MSWGQKRLVNQTGSPLQVTLRVRKSADPRENLGAKSVSMNAGDDIRVTYGDDANPFLNGIELVAFRDGAVLARQDVVILRGSPLDNELNTRDTISLLFVGGAFLLQAANTWTTR